ARTERRSRPRSRSSRRTRSRPARSRRSRRALRWRGRPRRTATCLNGRSVSPSRRRATRKRRAALPQSRSPKPRPPPRRPLHQLRFPRRYRGPTSRRRRRTRRSFRVRKHRGPPRSLRAPDRGLDTPLPMPAEILLVEDRESLRAMLEETLTREGYSVEAVATGGGALRRLAEGRRYTLVLTDYKMPGADGLAVLKAATASDAALPVVVLTGFGPR